MDVSKLNSTDGRLTNLLNHFANVNQGTIDYKNESCYLLTMEFEDNGFKYHSIIIPINSFNKDNLSFTNKTNVYLFDGNNREFVVDTAFNSQVVSELVSELPVYYSSKMKIECSDDQKQDVMTSIADEIKTTTDFELDLTDGVKILKEDGWVIIRPSGTEPIFRCFAESDSQQKADEMTEWGIGLIKKYKK